MNVNKENKNTAQVSEGYKNWKRGIHGLKQKKIKLEPYKSKPRTYFRLTPYSHKD